MSSSDNTETVCPAAAVADLRELGVTFPGAALDCGSNECPPCARRRATNNTASTDTETEVQRQDRLSHAIEAFFDNPETSTIPALSGEGDESSGMIDNRVVENELDALHEDVSAIERASINRIMWTAADREQPQLLSDIDARCGFGEEDSEMIDLNEAQIGLIEIGEANVQ